MAKKVSASVRFKDKMTFDGTLGRHKLAFDGYGIDGPSPLRVFLASLGACSAMLIKQALQAMHQTFSTLQIDLEADESERPPEVFTQVRMRVKVVGDVNEESLKRATNLVEEKYCGATVMIQKGGVNIKNSFEIGTKAKR